MRSLSETTGLGRKSLATVISIVSAVVLLFVSCTLAEHIDSDEVMVIQSPFDGTLTWHLDAGVKWQGGGKVTKYKKRDQLWFTEPENAKENESIGVRFNDGAHATISGSIAWEMPSDVKNLTALHTRYGSLEAIERQLIKTIVEKCVFMTGPLMSSAESYAARRNDLLSLIDDQIKNGVFKTDVKETKTKDPLTGQEKTVQTVELTKNAAGVVQRESDSPLADFGVKTFNLSIKNVVYDKKVEDQIQNQQKAIMDVQTAIAKAKTAEQDAVTAAKEGEANAAKAKWAQEVIKATEVTKAEQTKQTAVIDANREKEVQELGATRDLNVATTKALAAEQTKKEQTLLGEGEAARRRLVMEADGALEKKLAAYTEVNRFYADAIRGYQGSWVPNVYMAGGGSGSGTASNGTAGSGAMDLISLLTVKTAKDLSLDLATTPATAQRQLSSPPVAVSAKK